MLSWWEAGTVSSMSTHLTCDYQDALALGIRKVFLISNLPVLLSAHCPPGELSVGIGAEDQRRPPGSW